MALKHWPPQERPRERLFRSGVHSLSDAELLALFLRSGMPGQDARAVAVELLKFSEGLQGLSQLSPEQLLQQPGLGPAKVASLVASFEMGKRVLRERLAKRPVVDSAEEVFQLLRDTLTAEREEVFMGLLLNGQNEVLKMVTFSRGDTTQVIFSVPPILRRLLLERSAAVIFVHNHPSGDPNPSQDDRLLTERLALACEVVDIALHDHIVIAAQGFFSFAQQGLLGGLPTAHPKR